MREKAASFLNSVLGGVCIGIGGVVFLSCENKVTGAAFFCLGLFAICTFGFNLFTGKVGYVFEQPLSYTGFVLSVWLGNLVGAALVGYAVRATRIAGIAEKAAERMKKLFPGLKVCGTNDGYGSNDATVVSKINAARPDFVMVCLGVPKQEKWMAKYAGKLDVGLMAGLGGTLDVFSGQVRRAPIVWQKLNLEWLYRCFAEPKRFKKIKKLPQFILKAWRKRLGIK